MQALQLATGVRRQVAVGARLQFVAQASAQQVRAVVRGYLSHEPAPHFAQIVEAEVVQSGDLGLQRMVVTGTHLEGVQAVMR